MFTARGDSSQQGFRSTADLLSEYLCGRHHWCHSHAHLQDRGDGQRPSSHGHGRLGFENDLGHVCRSLALDDHLYVENSPLGPDDLQGKQNDDVESGHDGLEVRDGHHDGARHGQNQISTRLMEEYVPTNQGQLG